MRIARRGGGKIGLPEVNLGVLPGTGGTQRLCRIVGKPAAIELMVTGRTFEFDEAKELGIVNQILDADSRDAFLAALPERHGETGDHGDHLADVRDRRDDADRL